MLLHESLKRCDLSTGPCALMIILDAHEKERDEFQSRSLRLSSTSSPTTAGRWARSPRGASRATSPSARPSRSRGRCSASRSSSRKPQGTPVQLRLRDGAHGDSPRRREAPPAPAVGVQASSRCPERPARVVDMDQLLRVVDPCSHRFHWACASAALASVRPGHPRCTPSAGTGEQRRARVLPSCTAGLQRELAGLVRICVWARAVP